MDKLEKGMMTLVAKEFGKKIQKEVQNQCSDIQNQYKGAEKICKNLQNQIISETSSKTSDETSDDDDRSLLISEKVSKKVKKGLNHIQCEYKYQAEQIQSKVSKKWKSQKLFKGKGQQNDIEIEACECSAMEEKKPYREISFFKNKNSTSNNNAYSSQSPAQNEENNETSLYRNSTADQQMSSTEITNYQYFDSDSISDVYSTNLQKVDPRKTKNALKMVQMSLEKSGKVREAQVLEQVARDLDSIFTQNFYLVQSNETLKSQNINLLERKADLIKDIEDLQLQLDKSKSKKRKILTNCLNLKKKKTREI